jgi:twitching motility protein PilU
MNQEQIDYFQQELEIDFAVSEPGLGRFRVAVFHQRGNPAMVLRYITADMPKIEDLGLPPIMKDLAMLKRGLILMVGATGSGKSTSLAAMLNYRNEISADHILTVEDPIEFLHPNKKSIVNQREVGLDTKSFHRALRSAMRAAPDVILIGEIRDRESMEYAITFAGTGHLCLATLHANNANQALDRIVNFFPEEKREQLLMDLSLNIRALISQRLIPREGTGGGRIAAMEIMLHSPLIADLIFKGDVSAIKDVMARSTRIGMKTFDQSLYDLYEAQQISYEDALRNADSKNELRLRIKLESKREQKHIDDGGALKIVEEEQGRNL